MIIFPIQSPVSHLKLLKATTYRWRYCLKFTCMYFFTSEHFTFSLAKIFLLSIDILQMQIQHMDKYICEEICREGGAVSPCFWCRYLLQPNIELDLLLSQFKPTHNIHNMDHLNCPQDCLNFLFAFFPASRSNWGIIQKQPLFGAAITLTLPVNTICPWTHWFTKMQ